MVTNEKNELVMHLNEEFQNMKKIISKCWRMISQAAKVLTKLFRKNRISSLTTLLDSRLIGKTHF